MIKKNKLIWIIGIIAVLLIFSNNDVKKEAGGEWCYQETATEATACGGLSGGSYSYLNMVNPTLMHDGDWETYGEKSTTPANLISSYNIPLNKLSSKLTVKTSVQTGSIDVQCFSYYYYDFYTIASLATETREIVLPYECLIQSPLQVKLVPSGGMFQRIYEEAVSWEMVVPSSEPITRDTIYSHWENSYVDFVSGFSTQACSDYVPSYSSYMGFYTGAAAGECRQIQWVQMCTYGCWNMDKPCMQVDATGIVGGEEIGIWATYDNCVAGLTVTPPTTTCNLPWGGTIDSGNSVTAYFTSSVPSGDVCVSESRICDNGVLSGSYNYDICTVDAPTECTIPGDTYPACDGIKRAELGAVAQQWIANPSDTTLRTNLGIAAQDWIANGGQD